MQEKAPQTFGTTRLLDKSMNLFGRFQNRELIGVNILSVLLLAVLKLSIACESTRQYGQKKMFGIGYLLIPFNSENQSRLRVN